MERLIIHDIEIENFKSYAGKKKIGPFHESFTSIVGPNGSGKSNVIDAILFVFGYRSLKIRSKKLSLLIHTSETYPNIQSCSVYVYFRKIINGELDPDFKLTVSRTARKDNSSDYYIDGVKLSFKDVTQQLRELQIDLDHNRFLILQGEVEQISLMKPKGTTDSDEGLLEFLEDIIGSNKYKDQIKELCEMVDVFDEQMVEKINRVKIVEIDKNALETPKNEAMTFIENENKLNTLMNLDYFLKLNELNIKDCKVIELQKKMLADNEEIQAHASQIEVAKTAKLEELKNNEQICNPLLKSIEKQNKIVSNLERKNLKLKQDLIYNQENSEKLKNNMDKERITYESAKSMPIKSQADLEKLHRGQQIIENEIKQIDETIQGLLPEIQKKTAQLQTEKEQKDKVLLEKAKFLSETEIKVNTAKNSLDALVSKRDYLTSEIQKNKKNLADSEKMIDQQKSQYNDALNESPSLKNELNQASSRLKTLKDQESKIMTNLSEKRSLLEQLRFNESSLKNKSKIISELLKQKELGNICGIFGRLGDLATIDPKYDCAASSCCGYLDHCLVDTMDTAVKCVEFLRSSSLGVGSFIALDKMNDHKDACKSHFSGPPASVRVFDLLNPLESCFLPALYFAFRDTLVADNIDEATRTAFGKTRYRVVTLKGDIVEKNGTITTGGEPIRGRIRLSSASHSLDRSHSHIKPEDLTKEIDVLSNKQTELLQETIELEKKISSLSAKIEQLDVIIEKTPKQIRILEQECKSMVSVRSKLEKEYETCLPDQDELHKVQMNLEQQKKEKEKAQSNYDVVEQQIKKINQQMAVIRGNILDCHQTELNSKKRLLEDIHKELSKTSASVSANERALQKSESALIELKNNLEIASKKVHKLEEEYELSESELSSHRDSLLKMEEQNCGSSQLIKELQRQIKDLEQQHEACRRKMLDIKLKGDEIMSQVKAYEAKVQHIQHQIQKLVIRSFNNEGEEIVVSVPPPSDSEISDSNRNKINDQIKETQHYINSCKPDLNAIVQYLKQNKLYTERLKDLEDFTIERDLKNHQLKELKECRLNEFMDGFTTINYKLKEMYQLITLGGDAELELVDSLNPFIEGIVFSVRPPNKSWKHIANLSGGEKTLSSLALVFALHHYKPTPFYIMDEIDAALDFKNVSIIANYIKERTQNAQFIIISLRDNMFELANQLVGIYKTNDCTKSVVLQIDPVQITA